MKNLVFSFVFSLLLWWAIIAACTCVAKAQDEYRLFAIPMGQRIEVAGQTYQAYNLIEFKELLLVDFKYKLISSSYELRLQEIDKLQGSIGAYKQAVAVKEQQFVVCSAEVIRKDKELTKIAKTNIDLHDKLEWRKRLLRIGGSITGALIGGLVLGLIVSK